MDIAAEQDPCLDRITSGAVTLAVSGAAGAGKTTLTAALTSTAPRPATVSHGDDYGHEDPAGNGVWNLDENGVPRLEVGNPASIDAHRLDAHTSAALASGALVLVEGMFADRVLARWHARFDVFVDLAADLRLVRRIDVKCARGMLPVPVVLTNYVTYRRHSHEKYVEPARQTCDLVVDGARDPGTVAAESWLAAGRCRR